MKLNLLKRLQLTNLLSLILILIIPVSGCNLSGDNSFKPGSKKRETSIPSSILKTVQEGDIILRKGRGPFSEKIVEFMEEKNPFSHVGLVVNIDGKLTIVHSISEDLSGRDGVQTESLKEFSMDVADSMFCIVRPKVDSLQKNKIVELARFFLKERVPFDYDYHTDDSTKLYCSEFIYYTAGNVMGKEIFRFKEKGLVKLVLFDTFLDERYFEKVYCLKPPFR